MATPAGTEVAAPALVPDGDTQLCRSPRPGFPGQVLATVLHRHLALAVEPIAVLFDSSRTAMDRTLRKIRRLLEAHGIVFPPATAPPAALASLRTRTLAQASDPESKIKTTRR